jgi:hypothetical protein
MVEEINSELVSDVKTDFDTLLNATVTGEEKEDGVLLSQLETINKWTRDYGRLQITKHWKWTVLNIIQQAADKEKPQFDVRGNLIVEKSKPSLDGLGNSKECARDHILIFGLWAPNRYGILNYEGYNINRLEKRRQIR